MKVSLARVAVDEKPVLRELLNLYLYDLSSLVGRDPDDHGRFEYRYLDHYWTEEGRHAWFTMVDGALGGFVMANAHVSSDAERSMAEFFVMRRHRRSGVGSAAARLAFDALPGAWEVCTDVENVDAAPFWRATIADYTGGAFTEHASGLGEWTGPCFTFRSPAER